MNEGQNPAEKGVADQLHRVIHQLRTSPIKDPVARLNALEPAILAVAAAWEDAKIKEPTGALLGLARALKIEIDTLRARIAARGRVIGALQRALDERHGTTYTKGATRARLPDGVARGKAM